MTRILLKLTSQSNREMKLTLLFILWPKVVRTRNDHQSQEGQQKVKKGPSTLIILKFGPSHDFQGWCH